MKKPFSLLSSTGSCQNTFHDWSKFFVPIVKWTFKEVQQSFETRWDPIYGAYLEEQFDRRRRLLSAKTIVVLMPKFSLFRFGFGLQVLGIHFNAAKETIRDFRSKSARFTQLDPHIVEYQDLTTQGSDRFACRGLVWFRARQDEKYQAASGHINIPRVGRGGRGRRMCRVTFKWTRISEPAILAAIGKTEMKSLQDVQDFIRSL